MNFYHDQERNLLVYHGQSPLLQQVLPDLKPINGQYFAVPRTLRNLQILRYYNYPVTPIMDGYDWPRHTPSVPQPYETQKLQANFMVLHPRCFNLSDMGCVDAETEYLSPTGWKRIDQYDGGLVAQYHLDGRATFVEPSSYIVRPCSTMYRFKTARGVDQKLSAEHRVLYASDTGELRVTTAENIADLQEKYVQGWRGKFLSTFKMDTWGVLLTEFELRLMVAVIADGHFPNKSNRCVINVKKTRKKERLRRLLQQTGIEYKEKELPYESKKGYALFSFPAPRREKEFTEFYWACSQSQLQVVTDECWRWDGSAPVGNRGPSFCSTIKCSADFIQYAFAATGFTARATQQVNNRRTPNLWQVTTRNKSALLGLNGTREDGSKTTPVTVEPTIDGKKYCFEVPTTFLVLRRNGQIFITGNTGKTLSMLWAADFLMRQHPPGTCRALIVAPLSILQRVWADAIFKHFLNRRSFQILYGDADKRMAALRKPADFYIINFDGVGIGAHVRGKFELDGLSKELAERTDIKICIVDEASGYRDATTKRHRLARMVIGKRDYLWLATGTPTPNAPTDSYGLAKLVNNAFGKSFSTFQSETMVKLTQFKWIPRKDGYDKARQLLTPGIRIDIKSVWDGPELTTQQREVELTVDQKKHLADLKRDLQVVVKSGQPINAANEAAARQKFIQISLGAIYDSNHKAHAIDATPRIKELKAVIEQAPGKILIFAPLTSVLHLLYNALQTETRAIINGEVSQKERSKVFQAFQTEDKPRILIADPGTMAHGLDLWQAQTVVWYGITDRSEVFAQANKRAHRPGQKYPVTVVQLVSNPLEREIFRRLENNLSLQGALLDTIRKGDL